MEPVRVPLGSDGAITLGLPDDRAVCRNAPGHAACSRRPSSTWPTGVDATPDDVRQGLHLWLAAHDAAICSLWSETSKRSVPDLFGQVGALSRHARSARRRRPGAAGVARRAPAPRRARRPRRDRRRARSPTRSCDHVQAWARSGRPLDDALTIRAYPDARARAATRSGDGVLASSAGRRLSLTWTRSLAAGELDGVAASSSSAFQPVAEVALDLDDVAAHACRRCRTGASGRWPVLLSAAGEPLSPAISVTVLPPRPLRSRSNAHDAVIRQLAASARRVGAATGAGRTCSGPGACRTSGSVLAEPHLSRRPGAVPYNYADYGPRNRPHRSAPSARPAADLRSPRDRSQVADALGSRPAVRGATLDRVAAPSTTPW